MRQARLTSEQDVGVTLASFWAFTMRRSRSLQCRSSGCPCKAVLGRQSGWREHSQERRVHRERNARCAGKAKDAGGHEQQYVSSVIWLHDKYLQYVTHCFGNSSLFHKALKEAFESFCNKTVAGSSSAELMANFCNNLLRKVRRLQRGYDGCCRLRLRPRRTPCACGWPSPEN